MSSTQTLILILALLVVVVVFTFAVLPFLRRRGIKLDAVILQAQRAVDTATSAMTLVKPFVGGVKGADVFDKILTAARTGVGNAEQLYKVGILTGNERNAAAKQYVYDSLKLAGVDITPDIVNLVSGAVEASVDARGHKQETTSTSGFAQVVDGVADIPGTMSVTTSAEDVSVTIDPRPPDNG
jgi:hypothetical protein